MIFLCNFLFFATIFSYCWGLNGSFLVDEVDNLGSEFEEESVKGANPESESFLKKVKDFLS